MKFFNMKEVLDGTVTMAGKAPAVLKDQNVPALFYKTYLLSDWQDLQHVQVAGTHPITRDPRTGAALSGDSVVGNLAMLLKSSLPEGMELSKFVIGWEDAV